MDTPVNERSDVVEKVRNEMMRMYLGNHWSDEFQNPLQHVDHIALQTDQDRREIL